MQNFSCQTILTNSAIFCMQFELFEKMPQFDWIVRIFQNPHELSDNGKLGGNMESKISPKGNIGIKKCGGIYWHYCVNVL